MVFKKVEFSPSAFSDGDQRPRPGVGTIQLKISLGKLNNDKTDAPVKYDRTFLNQQKIEEGTIDKAISDRVG
jgi:hypothetical protein